MGSRDIKIKGHRDQETSRSRDIKIKGIKIKGQRDQETSRSRDIEIKRHRDQGTTRSRDIESEGSKPMKEPTKPSSTPQPVITQSVITQPVITQPVITQSVITQPVPVRLLVTGGAGFIGSNFVRYTLANRPNWRIINLDALTYAGNLANFNGLHPQDSQRHHFVHGDIRDTECLIRTLSEDFLTEDGCDRKGCDNKGCDAIIHFAAESHVDRSILGPGAFVETNVLGTFRLLEAARAYWDEQGKPDTFRLLHVSTDEVYGSLGPQGRFHEKSPYDPSSPYSASKASSDHLVRAYFRTYGLPAIVTNCSNNYGPYQFPEKLIPLMILNAIEKKPLPVYGDGKNIRDWLYVLDHCEALLRVLEAGTPGETYNIGGNSERCNIDIVHQLCDFLDTRLDRSGENSSHNLIRFVPDRPGHDRRYAIDASKIRSELGWEPQYDFEKALAATLDWYLDHLEWVNAVRSGEYRKWISLNYQDREEWCQG